MSLALKELDETFCFTRLRNGVELSRREVRCG
jgi:hypothetical protein